MSGTAEAPIWIVAEEGAVLQGTFRADNTTGNPATSIGADESVSDYLFRTTAYSGASGAGITIQADGVTIQRASHAAIAAGVFYVVVGLFGATVAALFAAFPKELILAIAGIALLGTIGNSLAAALREEREREPALVTFLVTASGLTLFSIGSAFWGIVAGVLTLMILNCGSEPARDGRQR